MADSKVQIKILTTADTSGTQAVVQGMDAVAQAAKEVTKAEQQAAKETVAVQKQAAADVTAAATQGARQVVTVEKQAAAEVAATAAQTARQQVAASKEAAAAAEQAAKAKADAAKKAAREQAAAAQQAAAEEARAASGRSAAILEFSRLIEDAQYGLKGILNNIPTLVMGLGGGAGLAGVASLAAIAISQIWDAFNTDDSGEAQKKLEQTKANTEAILDVLANVREQASKAFELDLSKYLEQLKEVTTVWERQKSAISAANEQAKAFAAAQDGLVKSGIEFERQQQLALAKTQEQRDAINKVYDARVEGVNNAATKDGMSRDYNAQLTAVNSATARLAEVEAAKAELQQRMAAEQAKIDEINQRMGNASDQQRRLDEAARLMTQMRANEAVAKQAIADIQKAKDAAPLGPITPTDAVIWTDILLKEAKLAELEKKNKEIKARLDELYATRSADEAAKASGKLTYYQLIDESTPAAKAKIQSDAQTMADIQAGRGAQTDTLATLDQAIRDLTSELRQQQQAMEKLILEQQTKLTEMQQQEFQRMYERALAPPQRDPLGNVIPAPLPAPGEFPAGPQAPSMSFLAPPVLQWVPGFAPPPPLPLPPPPVPGQPALPPAAYPAPQSLPWVPGMPTQPALPPPPTPGTADAGGVKTAVENAASSNAEANQAVIAAMEQLAQDNQRLAQQIAQIASQNRNSRRPT